MEEKEIWRDIEGYKGLYQVSNMGRVKSLNYRGNGKEGILKGVKTGRGYLKVILHKDGRVKHCKVHRLVASAFLPNPQNLPQINHKDENKENNSVDNLEWVTCKENANHGTRNQRSAENRSKPVIGIDKITGLILEFPSTQEASRVLGINQGNICSCLKGRLKSTGGFAFYYTDTEE